MKKSQPTKTLCIKYTLAVILIAVTLFSCDNLLKQTVIEDLTLQPPAMELIGANFDEEAQCYRSGFSVELSTNQRGVNIHYRLSMVGGTVQEGIYNGTPLLVGTHGKTFEFTAWCDAPQTLQSQTVGGRYYFEYQGLTAPLAAINAVYLQTIDEGSNQLNRDSLISLENHPSSQGAQIYYTIPGHPEFPDNLYKLYEAPFLLEGNSSDQGINYTLLTHASLLGQVDTNGDGQVEDVELVPSSPDRAFGIRIRYPLTAPPEYSQPTRPEGFSAPFSLTLSHPVEGTMLHYSLDGSDPDPAKGGTLYEQGTQLPIGSNGEGTQLRVHVTSPGCRSREFVQEYWINPELCPDPVITISPDLADNRLARSAVITGDNTVADNSLNSQVRSLVINRHFDLELSTLDMPQGGKIFYTLTDAASPQLPLFEQDSQGQYQAVSLNGTQEYSGTISLDESRNWTMGEELWLCTQTVAPDRTPSPPQYTWISLKYLSMPQPVFRWVDGENSSNNGQLNSVKMNYNNTPVLQLYVDLPEELDHIRDGLTFRCDVADKDNPGTILYKLSGNSENWNTSTPIQNLITTENTSTRYEYRFTWYSDQYAPVSATVHLTMDREKPAEIVQANINTADLHYNSDNTTYYLNSESENPKLIVSTASGINAYSFTLEGQSIVPEHTNNAVNLFDFEAISRDDTGQGTYDIEVSRRDLAGNWSDPTSFSVVKDTIAPEGYLLFEPSFEGLNISLYSDDQDCYRYAHDLDGDESVLLENFNIMTWYSNEGIAQAERHLESTTVQEIPIHVAFLDYANNFSETSTYSIVTQTVFATNGSTSAEPTGYLDDPYPLDAALFHASEGGYQEVRLLAGDYGTFPSGTYNFSIRGGYSTSRDSHGNLILNPPEEVDIELADSSNLSLFSSYPDGVVIKILNPTRGVTLSNLKFIELDQRAISASSIKTLSIENCYFSGQGGYMTLYADSSSGTELSMNNVVIENFNGGSNPVMVQSFDIISIKDSYFRSTDISLQGGSLVFESNGAVSITNSTFQNNSNSFGGAIKISSSSGNIAIGNNLFLGNKSSGAGGAVYVFYDGSSSTSSIEMSGNTFEDNTSSNNGGAIYITKNAVRIDITNNNFQNNSSGSAGNGGAVDLVSNQSPINLNNNTFTSNTGGNGGAISFITNQGDCSLQENSFISNTGATLGGAIFLHDNPILTYLYNNHFYKNNAATGGGVAIGNSNHTSTIISIGNRYRENSSDNPGEAFYTNNTIHYIFSDAFETEESDNPLVFIENPVNTSFFTNCSFAETDVQNPGTHSMLNVSWGSAGIPPVVLVNNLFYRDLLFNGLRNDSALNFSNLNGDSGYSGIRNYYYPVEIGFFDGSVRDFNIQEGESYPYFSDLTNQGRNNMEYHDEGAVGTRPDLDLDNDGDITGLDLSLFSIPVYSSDGSNAGVTPRLIDYLDIGAYEQ